MIYAFILRHQDRWPISLQCRTLGVTRSGFYAWLDRPPSPRIQEDAALARLIRQIFDLYNGVYGSPRITYEVRALGHRVSENRVARLMAHMGLRAVQTKAFKVATTVSNQDHPVAPDLLQQDFSANRPNQKWVGDVTYIATKEGWVYLATVIDLYSRKVVGWSMSDSLATPLVNDALEMAVRSRRPGPGTIFHSDRGCQYTSAGYRQRLADHGLLASMSRKGCCYDNAVAESFFHSLKVEWIRGKPYDTRRAARTSVFTYIEAFYNRRRRHSTLGYTSPDEFEAAIIDDTSLAKRA